VNRERFGLDVVLVAFCREGFVRSPDGRHRPFFAAKNLSDYVNSKARRRPDAKLSKSVPLPPPANCGSYSPPALYAPDLAVLLRVYRVASVYGSMGWNFNEV